MLTAICRAISRDQWHEVQKGELQYHAAKNASKILERNVPYRR